MNKKTIKLMFSNKSDLYETPRDFFVQLNDIFHFTLDPCAFPDNKLEIETFYTEQDNGLEKPWYGESVFCNPPYSNIEDWINKANKEFNLETSVIMLIPVRTDTKYFHNNQAPYIGLIKRRLKFENRGLPSWNPEGNFKKSSAPFPSMLLIYNFITGGQLDDLNEMGIKVYQCLGE